MRVCYMYFCCGNIWGGGGLGQPTPVFGTGRAGVSTFVVVCAINTSAVVIWGGVVGCKIARFLICE